MYTYILSLLLGRLSISTYSEFSETESSRPPHDCLPNLRLYIFCFGSLHTVSSNVIHSHLRFLKYFLIIGNAFQWGKWKQRKRKAETENEQKSETEMAEIWKWSSTASLAHAQSLTRGPRGEKMEQVCGNRVDPFKSCLYSYFLY